MLIFCKVTKSLREFLIFSDIFKFPLQGFYQAFNQLPPGEFIPSIVRTKEEEFQDYKVITQADVLAVSDGTGMFTAHGCVRTISSLVSCRSWLLRLNQFAKCGNSNAFMFDV